MRDCIRSLTIVDKNSSILLATSLFHISKRKKQPPANLLPANFENWLNRMQFMSPLSSDVVLTELGIKRSRLLYIR